jgi:hypothetical protein
MARLAITLACGGYDRTRALDRPWNHLEQLVDGVDVDEMAFGSGYIVTGRTPPQPPAS